MRIKKAVLLLAFMALVLFLIISSALAMPDPFATLVVWPVGATETGEPIVTTSPADLIIYNNDNAHVLIDLWLMLVINKPAFDHLITIATSDTVELSFLPEHFTEIEGTESPSHMIPLSLPGSEPPAYGSWPGMEEDDQYDVGSLRSKLGIPKTTDAEYESMYYAVGDLDSSPGWIDHGPSGLDKTDPEFFTITVDLTAGAGDWKVLVLALGYSEDGPHTQEGMLNVHSPYTKSTLIVPELQTLVLALAPMAALGLYAIRYKRTRNK